MGPIWPRCKVHKGLPLPLTLLQVVFTRLPRHGRETLKRGKTGRGGQRRRTRRKSTRSSSLEKTGVDSVGGEPNERRGPLNSRAFFQMLHKYSSEAVQMCTLCLWSCFFYLSLSCFCFFILSLTLVLQPPIWIIRDPVINSHSYFVQHACMQEFVSQRIRHFSFIALCMN